MLQALPLELTTVWWSWRAHEVAPGDDGGHEDEVGGAGGGSEDVGGEHRSTFQRRLCALSGGGCCIGER
jgi:hypothetical protein